MLEVRLFGSFEAHVDGQPLIISKYRNGYRLLALLALRRSGPVEREVIAEALWPDKEERLTRDDLTHTLYFLRRALGTYASRIKAVGTCLQLDRPDVNVDLIEFETAIQKGDVPSLERAVSLYHGPLLERWDAGWVSIERPSIEQAFLTTLDALATDALANQDFVLAIDYLRRYVKAKPDEETAQRRLMQVLAERGAYRQIDDVYRAFKQWLSKEVGAEPEPETTTLYKQLKVQSRLSGFTLPALNPPSRRLEIPLNSLIGRQHNIEEVLTILRKNRLVTLTGMGGIGKTRLAMAVAEILDQELPDRVWFVDLASTASQQVGQIIAKSLGISNQQDQGIGETLVQAFASKSMLLILDNCEQVLTDCAFLVERLLKGCMDLRILATSRETLKAPGERVYNVPTLGVPPVLWQQGMADTDRNFLDRVMGYDAPQLFRARAEAQQADFLLLPSEAKALVGICCHLDGIPLAIELAATKVRSMSVSAINVGLSDMFRLLKNRSSTALSRHKTLWAVIDWSYELLSEEERRLFCRLAVFAGGWTEPALAVCAEEGWDSTQLRDLLEELVDKSLVLHSGGAESRFRMLEPIREYALERLAQDSEAKRLYRQKHRDYFLKMAMDLNSEPSGQQQQQILDTLDAEYHNLDEALIFCTQYTEESQQGLRLGATLQDFWATRGYMSGGRERLKALLEQPEAQARTQARASALDGAGVLARMQGDYDAARVLHKESLEIFKELEDDWRVALAINNLGIVAGHQKDWILALSLAEDSLAMQRRLGNEEGIAFCLGNLGIIAIYNEDYVSARLSLEECLEMFKAQENTAGVSKCLYNLGNVAGLQNDSVAAHSYYRESLTLMRSLQDKQGIVLLLEVIADLAFQDDDAVYAIRLSAVAEQMRTELDSSRLPAALDQCNLHLAEARQTLGDEGYAKAWSQGKAMTVDQAIQYALEENDNELPE